ncbi:MAG: phosphoribosylglycinamide formyltransferase [Planctomycetota bacterium]|nr:phosphoribosylglycinamide formyltransferase [Planctomycetota bacterium]
MLDVAVNFSGGGRTVLNILDRSEAGELSARVVLAITDRDCPGMERIRDRGVSVERVLWTRGTTPEDYGARVWPLIEASGAGLVCNCGFLRLLLIPDAWKNRVLNIHPGLLPRFGGRGMWGDRVHRAVLEAGETQSGCTVHFADNEYDKGPVILRRTVPVLPGDTVDTLAARVFEQECVAYPEAIRLFAEGRLRIEKDRVSVLPPNATTG